MNLIECPPPGLYRNVAAETYFSWDAASSSTLNLIRTASPAHVLALREGRIKYDSDAKDRGTGAHAAILEPGVFVETYAIGPDVKLNTKEGKLAWQMFEDAHPGKTLIRGKDGAAILGMRDAVIDHPKIKPILDARDGTELSLVWIDKETGVLCKGRIDVAAVSRLRTLLDLKSTRSAKRNKFARAIGDYGYHVQAAMYLAGAWANGLEADIFAFAAVESAPPYCAARYVLDDRSLLAGATEMHRLLAIYRECITTGLWPGHVDDDREIGLNEWTLREIEGADDEGLVEVQDETATLVEIQS